MRISITHCVKVIALILFVQNSNAQDWKINIKDHCSNNTACNPFLSGATCGSAVFRTTHGSPSYYVNGTNKQVALQASVSGNFTQYGEGFTMEYAFQTGKTYTVKIVHQGLPQTGAVVFPRLIAALTNNPPRNNDACAQGHFNTSDVYSSQEFVISPALNNSAFTITPTQPVAFLWLRSLPMQNDNAGLLISSIEVDDHSVTPPGGPGPEVPPYGCHGSLDFCWDNHNYTGGWDFWIDNPTTMRCNVFKGHELYGETLLHRRFAAREINLVDGFEASAYSGDPNVHRIFFAMASNNPCYEVLSIHGVGNKVAPPEPPLVATPDPAINESKETEISVYPSVGNGNIRINGNIVDPGNAAITVADQSGRIVYQKSGQFTNRPVHLNLTHLANGMYYIRINSNTKVIVKKVIIKK